MLCDGRGSDAIAVEADSLRRSAYDCFVAARRTQDPWEADRLRQLGARCEEAAADLERRQAKGGGQERRRAVRVCSGEGALLIIGADTHVVTVIDVSDVGACVTQPILARLVEGDACALTIPGFWQSRTAMVVAAGPEKLHLCLN